MGKGKRIYEKFSGLGVDKETWANLEGLPIEDGEIAVLGRVVSIVYEGTVDGDTDLYEHEFKTPVWLLAPCARGLALIWGFFRITSRGIVDAREIG